MTFDTHDNNQELPKTSEPTLFDGLDANSLHESVPFDKVPMEQAARDGVLDAQALVDPATLIENMPPTDKTVLPPPENQFKADAITSQNNKWLKPIGGTALALAIGLGSFFAFKDSDDNDGSPISPSETIISTPTTDLLVTSTTIDNETNPGTDSQESAGDFTPILMNATTYNGLINEFKHNLDCMFNSGYDSIQQTCLKYILGEGDGELSKLFKQRLADTNDYRISHPDFVLSIEFSDPNPPETSDNIQFNGSNEVILLTRLTDTSGSGIKRYYFRKSLVNVQRIDTTDTQTEAWLLYREEAVTDGNVSFG